LCELDFSSALTGEALEAGREETESSGAMNGIENPARTNRLMEEVCKRDNLKAALRQVKANRGAPGVDGMTVGGIQDYLKQHWPSIREQLLNGTYEPKPVRRVEIAKPDGGVRNKVIENALVLAATRRLIRPSDAPPLGTIRSLAYFLPVIEEVLESRVSADHFDYLRYKLTRIAPVR
jgi:hypothetical protein